MLCHRDLDAEPVLDCPNRLGFDMGFDGVVEDVAVMVSHAGSEEVQGLKFAMYAFPSGLGLGSAVMAVHFAIAGVPQIPEPLPQEVDEGCSPFGTGKVRRDWIVRMENETRMQPCPFQGPLAIE